MPKGPDPRSERFLERQQREKEYKKLLPGGDEEPLPPPIEPIHVEHKPNRNDPCPCGSGKKYKHCCGRKAS